MFNWLSDRLGHLRQLARQHPLVTVLGLAGLAYSLFSDWRDDWATHDQQEKLRMVNFLPHLASGWWAAIAMAFVCAWLFEASFSRQRSNIRIVYPPENMRWAPMFGSETKILRAAALVRVRNDSATTLQDCRVRIRLQGDGEADEFEYPVAGPFNLLPDDHADVAILKVELSTVEKEMIVPLDYTALGLGGARAMHTHPVKRGNYKVTVEALASGSRIARKKMSLSYRGTKWSLDKIVAPGSAES